MTNYDRNILQEYADKLYSQAYLLIASTMLRYAFTVLALTYVGGVLTEPYTKAAPDTLQGSMIFFTLVAAAFGYEAGRRKAFRLKLEAQQILCQRQIEINTARPAKAAQTAQVPEAEVTAQ